MGVSNTKELSALLAGAIEFGRDGVKVLNRDAVRSGLIEKLAREAAISSVPEVKELATWLIRGTGAAMGVLPASIHELYMARGRGEVSGFTVPAVNIRGMTFYMARAMFRAAMSINAGAFIFEIAKSEMGYTSQRPAEYSSQIIAAAIAEGFTGPVFIQGDHFQLNLKKFREDRAKEENSLKTLIVESLEAGFYNIDIDSSTLVDIAKPDVSEQQKDNYEVAAGITAFIRSKEPKGVTVSVGGEIGEVGKKNSTIEELAAFMEGYNRTLKGFGSGLVGLSKMSVQTGTSHGGVVLPDGSIAKVALDFTVLETLGKAGRERYGMSGAVQHGASTLPEEAFDRFPEVGTAEVHLATGFQNMLYDSPRFPAALRDRIYEWVGKNCADERKPSDSEQQFIYKARKKGFGQFKKEIWEGIPESDRKALMIGFEEKFRQIFKKLRIENTRGAVERTVHPAPVSTKMPAGAVSRDEIGKEGDD